MVKIIYSLDIIILSANLSFSHCYSIYGTLEAQFLLGSVSSKNFLPAERKNRGLIVFDTI